MKRAFVIALTFCGAALLLRGQSQQSLRDQLVGTWRFVSSIQRLADGTTRPDPQTGPKAFDPQGRSTVARRRAGMDDRVGD